MGLVPPVPLSRQAWDWPGKRVAASLVRLTAESVLGSGLCAGLFT